MRSSGADPKMRWLLRYVKWVLVPLARIFAREPKASPRLFAESERMCVCSVPDPSGSLNGGAEICLRCSYWLRKPGSA